MHDEDKAGRLAVSQAISDATELLARRTVDEQYAADPELMRRFGQRGYDKSLSDARYNVSCLVESVALGDPTLFVSYCRWLQGVLVAARVDAGVLPAHLGLLGRVLPEVLTAEAASWVRSSRLDAAVAAITGGRS